MPSPIGIPSTIKNLPEYESLQLVEKIEQLRFPSQSALKTFSLDELKAFIYAYQSCSSVKDLVRNLNIPIAPAHMGRQLPSVVYVITGIQYRRRVSTRTELVNGNRGRIVNANGTHSVRLEHPVSKPKVLQQPKYNSSMLDRNFLISLTQAYLPEYKQKAVIDYICGRASLKDTIDVTGIGVATTTTLGE